MTTSKAVYVVAAIVPFGCVVLAAIALANIIYQRHRYHAIAARAGMHAPKRPMLVY